MLLMAADHEKSCRCFEQFNLGHAFVHTIDVARLQRGRNATPVCIKQRLKALDTLPLQNLPLVRAQHHTRYAASLGAVHADNVDATVAWAA